MDEEPGKEPGKHRRQDQWGPQAVIALVIVIGAFCIAGISVATGHEEATIPAWVAALVGAIGIYYYKANGKQD